MSLPSLGGCGADDGERVHDAEQVARCITGRSGALLTDPLNNIVFHGAAPEAQRDFIDSCL